MLLLKVQVQKTLFSSTEALVNFSSCWTWSTDFCIDLNLLRYFHSYSSIVKIKFVSIKNLNKAILIWKEPWFCCLGRRLATERSWVWILDGMSAKKLFHWRKVENLEQGMRGPVVLWLREKACNWEFVGSNLSAGY